MKTFLLIAILSVSAMATGQDRFLPKDPPRTVLENLKRGNSRFISHKLTHPHTDADRRELSVRQEPGLYTFATILSCSDPRVPVELIFDVGIMDVCVHRIPGNICGVRDAIAIEHDLRYYSTPLIVIMGHSDCNLVAAALDQRIFNQLPPNQRELLKPILAVVERVKENNPHLKERALAEVCTRENVMQTIHTLLESSPDILEMAVKNKILVAGAVYDLKTGKVDWIDHRKIWNLMTSINDSRKQARESK